MGCDNAGLRRWCFDAASHCWPAADVCERRKPSTDQPAPFSGSSLWSYVTIVHVTMKIHFKVHKIIASRHIDACNSIRPILRIHDACVFIWRQLSHMEEQAAPPLCIVIKQSLSSLHTNMNFFQTQRTWKDLPQASLPVLTCLVLEFRHHQP